MPAGESVDVRERSSAQNYELSTNW